MSVLAFARDAIFKSGPVAFETMPDLIRLKCTDGHSVNICLTMGIVRSFTQSNTLQYKCIYKCSF